MDSKPSYLESCDEELKESHFPPSGVVRRINFAGVSEDETIRVFLRVKPLHIENVSDKINTKHYQLRESSFISTHSNGKAEIQNEYFFNGILPPTISQIEVFDIIVRPRLEEVFHGVDSFLFSYGTTGSGKSYTIQGKGTEPGIIPRVLYTVFASMGTSNDVKSYLCPNKAKEVVVLSKATIRKLEEEKTKMIDLSNDILLQTNSKFSECVNDTIRATSWTEMEECLRDVSTLNIENDLDILFGIWISFIEIYNENIYDLFVETKNKDVLKLAIDENKTSYVKDIKYMCVSSWAEAYQLYLYGKHNLHVSPTGQNQKSSRSHCIFTIKIIKRSKTNDGSNYCSSRYLPKN